MFAQDGLIINGVLSNEDDDGKMIYLRYPGEDYNEITLDSCVIEDKKFTLRGNVADMPTLASVGTLDNNIHTLIVLEPGSILIEFTENDAHEKTVKVRGTVKNDELLRFLDTSNFLSKQITEANQSRNQEQYTHAVSQFKGLTFSYIKSNSNNRIGELLLPNTISLLDKPQISQIYEKMRPSFYESSLGKQVKMYLSQKDFSIGDAYEDVKLTSPEGKEIALSDYIGKHEVVLIDFWASWCGPCRKEMPHLIEAYEMYKSKGFEIVGVSLDQDENSWKNYIKSQNAIWPQMSDLKGWKSLAAQIYGVRSIPLTLLVDKNGVIIAKNLRGEELKQELGKLLK